MLKERMTPEELAMITGYSRQTINKWVRKEGWETSPKPGVQGGKARLIHVNEQVRQFIRSAQRATEPHASYIAPQTETPLESLLIRTKTNDLITPQRGHFRHVATTQYSS